MSPRPTRLRRARRLTPRVVFGVIALVSIAFPPVGSRLLDAATVKYFAWTSPTASCPTAGTTLPSMDDLLQSWHREMIRQGWTNAGTLVDGDIDLDRFCDPDSGITGCSDHSNGVDEADAVMVGTHGTDRGDHWEGLLRNAGTSGATCYANASGDFRAGDSDLEFLHFLSCHSMDDDNLAGTWRMMEDQADSPGNGRRVHVATGFHGLGLLNQGLIDEYEQVAHDGFRTAVRDAWIDNLYVPDICNGTDCGEICPVAYAIGNNQSGCLDHLLDDSYDRPGADPLGHAHMCFSYVEDCNGLDESTFQP